MDKALHNFKLGKLEQLCVQYANMDGKVTHILCKKLHTDANKTWILYAVSQDGTLTKVAHGSNPLKLEDYIGYIKDAKRYCDEDDTV